MIKRLRGESGQVVVVTTVFMAALLGGVALTLDVASWYREHRQAQATADAAVLSAAQALPDDPAHAFDLAKTYASRNGGGLSEDDIDLKSQFGPNDTIAVKVTRPSKGFFAQFFDIAAPTVGATAAARATLPGAAKWVAPITVNKLHPLLAAPGGPRFGVETTLPLGKTGAPGAFALLNLKNNATGTIGASELADWILKGFNGYLPLGDYFSDPGAKWNNETIQAALFERYGTELLFPVYDTLISSGSNAEYHIVGWVGFHVKEVTASGNEGTLTGYFTKYIADGLQPTTRNPNGYPDFGVRSIALVE